MAMSSEERARKFWHDWWNGTAPGDLYVGNAFVDEEEIQYAEKMIDEVRAECMREIVLSLAEHDRFLDAADFVKRRIPPPRVQRAAKYPPDTEYE